MINSLFLLCLLLSFLLFAHVESRGVLSIKLKEFHNPWGRTFDGRCCDEGHIQDMARHRECGNSCDYVMRLIVSGLGRANDHVFLFHRPLKYNSNDVIFYQDDSNLILTVLFDKWPLNSRVKMSSFFYDYDDQDHTTTLVDWFVADLKNRYSDDTKRPAMKGNGVFSLQDIIGNREQNKTKLVFEWAVLCSVGSDCIEGSLPHYAQTNLMNTTPFYSQSEELHLADHPEENRTPSKEDTHTNKRTKQLSKFDDTDNTRHAKKVTLNTIYTSHPLAIGSTVGGHARSNNALKKHLRTQPRQPLTKKTQGISSAASKDIGVSKNRYFNTLKRENTSKKKESNYQEYPDKKQSDFVMDTISKFKGVTSNFLFQMITLATGRNRQNISTVTPKSSVDLVGTNQTPLHNTLGEKQNQEKVNGQYKRTLHGHEETSQRVRGEYDSSEKSMSKNITEKRDSDIRKSDYTTTLNKYSAGVLNVMGFEDTTRSPSSRSMGKYNTEEEQAREEIELKQQSWESVWSRKTQELPSSRSTRIPWTEGMFSTHPWKRFLTKTTLNEMETKSSNKPSSQWEFDSSKSVSNILQKLFQSSVVNKTVHQTERPVETINGSFTPPVHSIGTSVRTISSSWDRKGVNPNYAMNRLNVEKHPKAVPFSYNMPSSVLYEMNLNSRKSSIKTNKETQDKTEQARRNTSVSPNLPPPSSLSRPRDIENTLSHNEHSENWKGKNTSPHQQRRFHINVEPSANPLHTEKRMVETITNSFTHPEHATNSIEYMTKGSETIKNSNDLGFSLINNKLVSPTPPSTSDAVGWLRIRTDRKRKFDSPGTKNQRIRQHSTTDTSPTTPRMDKDTAVVPTSLNGEKNTYVWERTSSGADNADILDKSRKNVKAVQFQTPGRWYVTGLPYSSDVGSTNVFRSDVNNRDSNPTRYGIITSIYETIATKDTLSENINTSNRLIDIKADPYKERKMFTSTPPLISVIDLNDKESNHEPETTTRTEDTLGLQAIVSSHIKQLDEEQNRVETLTSTETMSVLGLYEYSKSQRIASDVTPVTTQASIENLLGPEITYRHKSSSAEDDMVEPMPNKIEKGLISEATYETANPIHSSVYTTGEDETNSKYSERKDSKTTSILDEELSLPGTQYYYHVTSTTMAPVIDTELQETTGGYGVVRTTFSEHNSNFPPNSNTFQSISNDKQDRDEYDNMDISTLNLARTDQSRMHGQTTPRNRLADDIPQSIKQGPALPKTDKYFKIKPSLYSAAAGRDLRRLESNDEQTKIPDTTTPFSFDSGTSLTSLSDWNYRTSTTQSSHSNTEFASPSIEKLFSPSSMEPEVASTQSSSNTVNISDIGFTAKPSENSTNANTKTTVRMPLEIQMSHTMSTYGQLTDYGESGHVYNTAHGHKSTSTIGFPDQDQDLTTIYSTNENKYLSTRSPTPQFLSSTSKYTVSSLPEGKKPTQLPILTTDTTAEDRPVTNPITIQGETTRHTDGESSLVFSTLDWSFLESIFGSNLSTAIKQHKSEVKSASEEKEGSSVKLNELGYFRNPLRFVADKLKDISNDTFDYSKISNYPTRQILNMTRGSTFPNYTLSEAIKDLNLNISVNNNTSNDGHVLASVVSKLNDVITKLINRIETITDHLHNETENATQETPVGKNYNRSSLVLMEDKVQEQDPNSPDTDSNRSVNSTKEHDRESNDKPVTTPNPDTDTLNWIHSMTSRDKQYTLTSTVKNTIPEKLSHTPSTYRQDYIGIEYTMKTLPETGFILHTKTSPKRELEHTTIVLPDPKLERSSKVKHTQKLLPKMVDVNKFRNYLHQIRHGPRVVIPVQGLYNNHTANTPDESVVKDEVDGQPAEESVFVRTLTDRLRDNVNLESIFTRHWPAVLGISIGTVFLVTALITSLLCRRQRLMIQRGRWTDSPQHLNEPPDTSDYATSSAASLTSDLARSSINLV